MSVGRRAGATLMVLAALAAGRAVSTAFPLDDRLDAPFVQSGAVGEVVELRYASVTAGDPEGSRRIDILDALLESPGIWLVVPLTVVAKGEPRLLGYAAVRGSDGRTYRADGMRSQFVRSTAQPGIPHYGSVVVELPPSAAAGAQLLVSLDGGDQRGDGMAKIDLGITAADVEQWAATLAPVDVPWASDLAEQP